MGVLVVMTAGIALAIILGVRSEGKTCTNIRSAQCIGESVLSSMDLNADPCDDFYKYACGSWIRKQTIPPDHASYGRSFSSTTGNVQNELRELLEVDLQDEKHPNAIAGRFYSSCMNGMAIGPVNLKMLARFRPIFDGLKTAKSFASALGTLHSALSPGMFKVDIVASDDKDRISSYVVSFQQGGLGLYHPDKYTSKKPADDEVRTAYKKQMVENLKVCVKAKLLKPQNIEELARKTFEFETMLARIHKAPEERRDPAKLYNPTKLKSFPKDIFIEHYLQKLGIDKNKINSTIIVEDSKFLRDIAKMMGIVAVNKDYREAVKGYLGFHLISEYGSFGMMGEEIYDVGFRFIKVMSGVKNMSEKWKRCQTLTTRVMPEALNEAYVRKNFPASTRKAAEKLSAGIKRAFRRSLSRQTWMDSTTTRKAQEKLAAMSWKVGYSTKFDEYRDLLISEAGRDFAENVLNTQNYKHRKKIAQLGKPVDKSRWFLNAYEANAYYEPTQNEIVFPAGILQPPFFSDFYPDAMNYGSIGTVIGHELSHGFDGTGRNLDKDGRLTEWWSTSSAEKYEEKAQCFVDLFDGYKPRSVSSYVKGNLTLDENLADANGVKVSFQAFKKTGDKNADPKARAPNRVLAAELTNHQLFFVAYAQTWCRKWRPKALEKALLTDFHSPGQFRVQGPLSQLESFASTFKCKAGATYNPEKRCSLW